MGRTVKIQNLTPYGWTVTQNGHGGAPLSWTFGPATNSSSSPFTFYYSCRDNQTVSGQSVGSQTCPTTGSGGGTDTLTVPSSNANSPLVYTFQYGALSGLLQTVTLPTGASTTYSYQCNNYPSCYGLRTDLLNPVMSKQVNWYDQSDGGQVLRTENWSFGGSQYSYAANFTTTAPDGGTETTYLGGSLLPETTKVVEPNGDSIDYFYQLNRPYGVSGGSPNPYVAAQVRNVALNGTSSLSSVTLFQTDKNGNQLGASTYDWSAYTTSARGANGVLTSMPSASGTMLRQAQNAYTVTTAAQAGSGSEQISDDPNAYWNAASPRFLHLLASTSNSGTGTGALSTYAYDGNGNPLQQARWDSNKASSKPSSLGTSNASVTGWSWDSYGNLKQENDPRGNETFYTYDSNNLFLVQKVAAYGTSVARTFTYGWDGNLGLLTSKTDVDNGTSTGYSYDPMGRLTNVTEGASPLQRETQTIYNDAAHIVTVKRDQSSFGDGALTNITFYDQLGRTALSQQMESPTDTSGIKVQTRYMYSGSNSYKLVSNPYRASTSSAASSEATMGWTVTTYDQNGRAISSGSFNGSAPPAPWGSNASTSGAVTISYSAQNTSVTDQAGSQRTSSVDGLGRLNLVLEYPGTGSYSTSYTYDALDNLSGVSQSGLTRAFVYDSLKRLVASKNPENWTPSAPAALGCAGGTYATCYYYDADGNLTSKLDNRGSLVSYQYDPLNRLTNKLYNNQAAVAYTYSSSGVYSKGRLSSVSTLTGNTSTTNYSSYDALGRVTGSSQSTAGTMYSFSYRYNLTDALSSETYPSGRVVNTCYDGANGVNQVGGNCAALGQSAYLTGGQYAAHGAFSQYQYGNGVQRTAGFNSRLQPLTLVDQLTTQTLFNASLSWGTTNNNGNLQSAAYPTGGFTDTFTYDGVNRLYTASDSGGWSRTFSYDAFGNMMATGNPSVTALAFNSNNQIVGKSYDQAGNQLSVNGNTVAYDLENHVVSETDGVSQAVESYVYDGDGRRVEKYGPGGTPRAVFVYDAVGRMAAEYDSTVTIASPCITCYLSDDHLGTARLVTDSNGKVAARHDYLPFGEEVAANTFGRNGTYGSGADAINQKFTGKERDAESGLDYFGARYYGSSMGRFTSPDPIFFQKEMLRDPQRFNLYAYVRNSPLQLVDPTGETIQLSGETDEERKKQLAAIQSAVGDKAKVGIQQDKDGNSNVSISGDTSKGAAKDFASIIGNSEVAKFSLVSKYETLPTDGKSLSQNNAVGEAGRDSSGQLRVYVQQESIPNVDGSKFDFSNSGLGTTAFDRIFGVSADTGTETGHEFGHALYLMNNGRSGSFDRAKSDKAALDLENKVRQNRDPAAPVRTVH